MNKVVYEGVEVSRWLEDEEIIEQEVRWRVTDLVLSGVDTNKGSGSKAMRTRMAK